MYRTQSWSEWNRTQISRQIRWLRCKTVQNPAHFFVAPRRLLLLLEKPAAGLIWDERAALAWLLHRGNWVSMGRHGLSRHM